MKVKKLNIFQKFIFIFIIIVCVFGFMKNIEATSGIEFINPTLGDMSETINVSMEINVSIIESDLREIKFSWDNENYTFYDNSLVFMANFNNISALGENDTNVRDLSMNANNGTVFGASWNSTGGKYNGAYEFDGNGDYIDCGNDSSLEMGIGNFSISFWVKQSGAGNKVLLRTSDVDTNSEGYVVYVNTDQYLLLKVSNGTSFVQFMNTSVLINDSNFHHVVYNIDREGYTKGYYDGVEIFSGSSYFLNQDIGNFQNLWIGASTASYKEFNGTIDEVKIWNRSLSKKDVQKIYLSSLKKNNESEWNLYINQSQLDAGKDNLKPGVNNYKIYVKDAQDNYFVGDRNIVLEYGTTEYYDNRKMSVVWTNDDYSGAWQMAKWINASHHAEINNIINSVAIIANQVNENPSYDDQWTEMQRMIDGGFTVPVSHSLSHQHIPYDNTTEEVWKSQQIIIGNLTLPWQNTFNGTEYIAGWVEPYGESDSAIRGNLSEYNYLSDRGVTLGDSSWAKWSESDGLYERSGVTAYGDNHNITELNDYFDTAYLDGGIYHLYMHPATPYHNWTVGEKIIEHLEYIGNNTDAWYVDWGHLYMYHYLENKINPGINKTADNDNELTFKMNVSSVDRNKYGLSYPITYGFYFLPQWEDVFVFYKNISSDNYTLMSEKTSDEYWSGIEAYRKNLSESVVYVSKSFPQEYNEFYLKIFPILSTKFVGESTDLMTVNISNITEFVLENSTYGKINFSEVINLSAGGDLNTNVNFSQNYISINSTALPELDKSATLTLYNLTYTNPRILRNGVECSSDVCTKISYINGNLIFIVSGFSNYSSDETPVTSTSTGGSSSGGSSFYRLTEADLQEGYSKKLARFGRLSFDFENKTYILKLNDFNRNNKTATIAVSPNLQVKNILVSDVWNIDLNNDSLEDILVRLDNVTSMNSEIFIKKINKNNLDNLKEKDEYLNEDDLKENDEENYKGILFLLIVLIVILLKISPLFYRKIKKILKNFNSYPFNFNQ